MITDFKMLIAEAASRGPRKVAVVLPHEAASIEAINDAQIAGVAEGVLIGHSNLIESLLKDLKILPSRFVIHHEMNEDLAAEYGVELAASGGIDILLKGNISTNKLLGAALRGPRNLRAGATAERCFHL